MIRIEMNEHILYALSNTILLLTYTLRIFNLITISELKLSRLKFRLNNYFIVFANIPDDEIRVKT